MKSSLRRLLAWEGICLKCRTPRKRSGDFFESSKENRDGCVYPDHANKRNLSQKNLIAVLLERFLNKKGHRRKLNA